MQEEWSGDLGQSSGSPAVAHPGWAPCQAPMAAASCPACERGCSGWASISPSPPVLTPASTLNMEPFNVKELNKKQLETDLK